MSTFLFSLPALLLMWRYDNQREFIDEAFAKPDQWQDFSAAASMMMADLDTAFIYHLDGKNRAYVCVKDTLGTSAMYFLSKGNHAHRSGATFYQPSPTVGETGDDWRCHALLRNKQQAANASTGS